MKLLLPAFFFCTAAAARHQIKHPDMLDNLPSTGAQWQTAQTGMEFQPAQDLSPLAQEHLRRLTSTSTSKDASYSYGSSYFLDGAETYYDEYAQAWRVLGFYIDCNADGDGNEYEDRNLEDDNAGCQRFLLWAAYIDENYEGNEVGEYIFWDRKSQSWDNSACEAVVSSRCVKMDCHEPDTHFTLLGFFKEPKYDEWMEQLFKHEGDCVWTDEEFKFMQQDRDGWPHACTESYYTDENGVTLYYDTKPEPYGVMSIGIYNDDLCIDEYTGNIDVGDVFQWDKRDADDYAAASSSLEEELAIWNDYFSVWRQCQPCKAYDLTNIVAGKGYDSNRDGDRYDGDEEFKCHDDAGYDDVNQCMKFKTKTKMLSATYRDVEMAGHQGTITRVAVGNYVFGSSISEKADTKKLILSYGFLAVSACLFLFSIYRYRSVKSEQQGLTEPLVPADEAVIA